MHFEVGNSVEIIDDALKGRILAIKDKNATVVLEDGFEINIPLNELVKIEDASLLQVSNHEISKMIHQKDDYKNKKSTKIKPKERNAPKMEVDLHIHQLTSSSRGMSNFDMLTLQLDTAKHKLEFAMRNKIQKVVFIL